MVIWQFTDGKPGHENQALGVAEALNRIQPVELVPIRAGTSKPEDAPAPDLLFGAGHGTHRSLLFNKWLRRAPAVVFMKPSLPRWLFDLCLIPRHDLPEGFPDQKGRVIATYGAPNRVRPAGKERRGLFLIGGPSLHHNWDEAGILHAVGAIASLDPSFNWDLTTSRRTPESFLPKTRSLPPNVLVTPVSETPSGWVPQKLASASRAWVSADSVSMLYEALSSGASVGVLHVPLRGRPGRVAHGVDELVNRGWLCELEKALKGGFPASPAHTLNEADRCARLILERFPRLARNFDEGPRLR